MINRLAPSRGLAESAAYSYIRAWGRYIGLDNKAIHELLVRAAVERAPSTVYAITTEGKWLDARDLEPLARDGGTVALYTLEKLREYAGAGQ